MSATLLRASNSNSGGPGTAVQTHGGKKPAIPIRSNGGRRRHMKRLRWASRKPAPSTVAVAVAEVRAGKEVASAAAAKAAATAAVVAMTTSYPKGVRLNLPGAATTTTSYQRRKGASPGTSKHKRAVTDVTKAAPTETDRAAVSRIPPRACLLTGRIQSIVILTAPAPTPPTVAAAASAAAVAVAAVV